MRSRQVPSGPGTPRFKRKRTAHACEECRHRKSRCNGGRPSCDGCQEMGFVCRYRQSKRLNTRDYSSSSESLTQSQAVSFEERLERIEGLLQALANSEREKVSHDTRSSSENFVENWISECSDQVDRMGCVTFPCENNSGQFGPTSNSAFLEQIIDAIASSDHPPMLTSSEDIWVITRSHSYFKNTSSFEFHFNAPQNRATASSDSFSIPLTQNVIFLLELYFETTGDIFPYLDKATVVGYLALDQKGNYVKIRAVEACIINTCMAFASIHGRPEIKKRPDMDVAHIYIERARSMLPEILSQSPSLETIQALLIFLQYSQGSQKSSETWKLMSSIVERAFQTGLYRSTIAESTNPVNDEIRRRTWWMCLIMDKMCSMTFGRPPFIQNSFITSFLPMSFSLILGQPSNPSVEPDLDPFSSPGTCLFLHTSKLSLILGLTIDIIYVQNMNNDLECGLFDLQKRSAEIDCQLTKWRNSLPKSLNLESVLSPNGVLSHNRDHETRAVVILSLRYLNLRALLYRGVLCHLLDPRTRPETPREVCIMSSSVTCCLESAIQTIKVITHEVEKRVLLPISWFSAYYILTASLTIFAGIVLSLKQPIRLHGYLLSDLLDFLQMALGAIEHLTRQNMVVSRYRQSIERIIETCRSLVNQESEGMRIGPHTKSDLPPEPLGLSSPDLSNPETNRGENYDSITNAIPGQSWLEPQVEFDMEWASSLALDIQDCWGGL